MIAILPVVVRVMASFAEVMVAVFVVESGS